MHCKCIIFSSISKIREVDDSNLICTNCPLIKEYRKLVESNKVNPVEDMTEFNRKNKKKSIIHRHRRGRNKKNASSNKGNPNRTLPKSRKKFKNK